jgi:hypothetical protein
MRFMVAQAVAEDATAAGLSRGYLVSKDSEVVFDIVPLSADLA